MSKRTILRLAVSAAEILLANGAEIFRVQETIEHILNAFGLKDYQTYVLSNGIFVALDEEGGEDYVALRQVPAASFHLGRIAAVNELSREIVRSPDPTRLEDYRKRLEECRRLPAFPLWLCVLCCGVGSGGFSYLFGGGVTDSLAAFVAGAILHVFLSVYGRKTRSRFMHTLLGAALVTSVAVGFSLLGPQLSRDHVIIGAIMSLVPGVALTTAIRDFFNGDFLSGIIHLTEAILTAVCIAVGVGVALQFWSFVGGILV